jgi:hypothetical protein
MAGHPVIRRPLMLVTAKHTMPHIIPTVSRRAEPAVEWQNT